MKNVFFIVVLFFTAMVFSQNHGSIRGSVTDIVMENEPLLMANVQIKGNDTIIQTNFNGNYEISDLEIGKYTLLVSYLGYESQEIQVEISDNSTTTIDVQLAPIQISFSDIEGIDSAFEEVAKE